MLLNVELYHSTTDIMYPSTVLSSGATFERKSNFQQNDLKKTEELFSFPPSILKPPGIPEQSRYGK